MFRIIPVFLFLTNGLLAQTIQPSDSLDLVEYVNLPSNGLALNLNITESYFYNTPVTFREEKAIRKDLKKKPLSAELHDELGRLYFKQELYDSAMLHLTRALELYDIMRPYNAEIFNKMARIYELAQDYESAGKYYSTAFSLDAENADALHGVGSMYLMFSMPDSAAPYLDYALQLNPNNRNYITSCFMKDLFLAMNSFGDLNKVKEKAGFGIDFVIPTPYVSRYEKTFPKDESYKGMSKAMQLLKYLYVCFSISDMDSIPDGGTWTLPEGGQAELESILAYFSSQNYFPNPAIRQECMGVAQLLLGRFEEAQKTYLTLVEDFPENTSYPEYAATACLFNKNARKAISILDNSWNTFQNPATLKQLYTYCHSEEYYDLALEYVNKYALIDTSFEPKIARGSILFAQKDYLACTRMFQEDPSLKTASEYGAALYIATCIMTGKKEDAKAEIAALRSRFPESEDLIVLHTQYLLN